MTDTQVTQAIAEVAELSTPATNVSQVIAEVAYTASTDTGVPSGTSLGGGGQTKGQYLPRGERLLWTVDNTPVQIEWTGLTARANGGYEQADLIIPSGGDGRWRGTVNRGAPQSMHQGSIVRAYRENGDILYEAAVASEPQSFQGEVKFWTAGAVEILRRNATRLPFQLAGGAGWVDRSSDPFGYANNQKYDLFSKDKLIGWNINTTEAYASGNKAGFVLMVSNWSLNRIAFTLNKTADNSNFDLELYTGDDAGSLTLDKQWSMGAGHPDGDLIDYTIATQGNTISLVLTANGATTPANRNKIYLTHLRVNGIGTDDETTTSDVIGTLARKCDYRDTQIVGAGTAALPLDWEGAWSDLADTMAEMDDWRWIVLADPSRQQFGNMFYGPYGGEDQERTWHGVQGEGLDCDILVLPRYNHVDVAYESPAGVPQTLQRDATDVTDLLDPLPDDVYPYPETLTLDNVQDSTDNAKQLADAALTKLTKLRSQGSIKVSRLLDGQPYDILPGDLVNVGGFHPTLPPQRIASVTYEPGGTVRLDVERAITVADVVARAFRRRVRGKR